MLIQARNVFCIQISLNDLLLDFRHSISQILGVRTLIFVFIIQNAACGIACVKEKQEPEVYEQTLFIELTPAGQDSDVFSAIVKGRPVMVATKNRFNLAIHNPGSRALTFNTASVGCNCLKAQFDSNTIEPGGSIKGFVDYAAPQRHGAEDYTINIILKHAGEIKCSLSISGELEGVLEILCDSVLESNGELSTWRLPILATPPIEAKRLKLTMPPQLRDLYGKIEIEKGRPYILVSGPEKSLGTEATEGIAGDILIEDSALGIKSTARVTFLKRPKVRISPKIAFFTKSDEDNERYEANFLIQAVANLSEPDGNSRVTSNVIQEIEIDSEFDEFSFTTNKINDSLCRVKVRFSAKNSVPDECRIDWKVRTVDGVYTISSLAIFPEE